MRALRRVELDASHCGIFCRKHPWSIGINWRLGESKQTCFLDTEQDDTEARAGRTSVSSDVDVSNVSSDDEVVSIVRESVAIDF